MSSIAVFFFLVLLLPLLLVLLFILLVLLLLLPLLVRCRLCERLLPSLRTLLPDKVAERCLEAAASSTAVAALPATPASTVTLSAPCTDSSSNTLLQTAVMRSLHHARLRYVMYICAVYTIHAKSR
jgi:hypothetical protein